MKENKDKQGMEQPPQFKSVPKQSIILIGMPGSGKSTIGVRLAKATNRKFLDVDRFILARERLPLQTIINTKGLEYFATSESRAILALRQRGQVIATGGSAVLHEEAMEHLRQLGKVVYLDVPFIVLKRRLWNLKTRGIVLTPGQTLEDLYNQRKPYYEKYADITITPGRTRHETVVNMIIEALANSEQ